MPSHASQPQCESYPSPSTESIDSLHSENNHERSPDSSFDASDAVRRPGPGKGADYKEKEDFPKGSKPPKSDRRGTHQVDTYDAESRRVLDLIDARRDGRPLDDKRAAAWAEFSITPEQYCKLLRDLKPVRHDYDPRIHLLVLRLMPTSIHDIFGRLLMNKITTWISQSETDNNLPRTLRDTAAKIIDASTSDVEIEVMPAGSKVTAATKSPDQQYHFRGSRYPPFVVEISYSQDRKDLPALARQYYEDSKGRIKTVLTFDLEYMSKSKRKARLRRSIHGSERQTRSSSRRHEKEMASQSLAATFSLYRGPDRIISNRLFRDRTGKLVDDGEGLSLRLSDLVPDHILDAQRLDDIQTLQFTAKEMFDNLILSEACQEDRDKSPTKSPSPGPSAQKRKVNWEPEAEDLDEEDGDDGASSEGHDSSAGGPSSKRRRRSVDGNYSGSRSGTAALPALHMAMRSHGSEE